MPSLHQLSLRLLCSSSSSPFLSRFSVFSNHHPSGHFTVLAYAGRPSKRFSGTGGGGGGRDKGKGGRVVISPQKRRKSTQKEEEEEMEDSGEGLLGFNKRRAEGTDKKPKTLQLKTRKLNPVNTTCYVQILGTGMDTQDTSPSVLLFFDRQRFIFNAGEGLQRYCTEHKIKLSKIDHMFLTRVCSETAGGLPGLLLTLAGMGEEGMSVNMWGPSDLNYLVDAMRSFIPNAAIVHTHSFGVAQNGNAATSRNSEVDNNLNPIVLIDDEVVRISAITLRPRYCERPGDTTGISDPLSMSTSLDTKENKSYLSGPLAACSEGSQRKANADLAIKPGDIAVVYACELPEIKGKFDPSKAVALGLKPGPKYRELQLGNSVKSDRLDIMVHPSDVLGPSSPGPIFLLVDCPTEYHMLELFSAQSLCCYYSGSPNDLRDDLKSVHCIIHLGPASVTSSVEYRKWMKRFGSAQHIMAGHEIKNVEIPILKSSARISSRLNYICPQLFPAPGFWSAQHMDNFHMEPSPSCEEISPHCESISAANLLKFHLRPYAQLGLDKSGIPSIVSRSDIINELMSEIPEIVDISKQVGQFWHAPVGSQHGMPTNNDYVDMVEEPYLAKVPCISNANLRKQESDASEEEISLTSGSFKSNINVKQDMPSCLESITREDMEFVLLGTGSSQPSKYRNVSSIYVNLFSKGGLLLDCGEGTLAQLKRRFGVKGADDVIGSLRCVWISHIHADHHTGLARILALRCQLLKGVPHEPLFVIGPRPLKRFLDAYSRLEDLDMEFLDCRNTTEAAMDSLLSSHESRSEISSSAQQENTLFSHGNRMQSYWKRPGSPVDMVMLVPALRRLKEVLHEAGLEALYSVPVVHCPQAFAVVLKAAERKNGVGMIISGWKLVYSGDTRPCQALIDASRDATVLIHEATFEDSMADEALARNHSTTMEAIQVGASAGAYRIILTHFSQRYPKIPVFDETHMHNTCIAFDLMSVNAADLPVIPKVLPYFKVLFRNEMVVDESEVLESAATVY